MISILSGNKLAVNVFNTLAEKMIGKTLNPADQSDSVGDLIVIGSDSNNSFVAEKMLDGSWEIPEYRSGSDDYFIRSYRENGRKILLLGGGRPRAVLYAIYAYFEMIGCSYFWDGDIIPQLDTLPLDGFDVQESPRFEYRGLRYFAHRSLHRFQAEHWSLDDWKKEIDWILKKRLNLFMLRIGQDDLFQKAFPDIVPYPQDNTAVCKEFARSYNDRTHFWSLQERGKLLKALMDYAFERDLIHPEDTGTMSHWYSRTPREFLDTVKPEFIRQNNSRYQEPSGLVWDIRNDRNLENYFKLTQTHIDCYGKGEIFHTIGLAERDISPDRTENHRWKIYAYRRIQERLRQSYPDAPLLIASWDFVNNSWTSDEIRDLLASFDPKKTILLDYTSDSTKKENNFTNWHCVGKFPWIFGIFQAFEPGNDLRGNYSTICERLAIAKNDPYCKGMIIWPENSHADTLMYEYFAANSWKPEYMEIHDFIPVFCRKRYGKNAEKMRELWIKMLPLAECGCWKFRPFSAELFGKFCDIQFPLEEKNIQFYASEVVRLKKYMIPTAELLENLVGCDMDDQMIKRDVIDMARTAGGRIIQYLYDLTASIYPDRKSIEKTISIMREALLTLADIVKSSPEFSLCYSLDELKKYRPVNPVFEQTLKGNADNKYCRSYIAELFDGCYLPEFEFFASHALGGKWDQKGVEDNRDKFHAAPLENYRPDCEKSFSRFAENTAKLARLARESVKIR